MTAGHSHPQAPLIRWAWLGLLAFALQLLLVKARLPAEPAPLPLLLLSAHLLLLPFLWANRSLIGVRLIIVGLLLNLVAMGANGGLMPVEASTAERIDNSGVLEPGSRIPGTKNVLLSSEDVRLPLLADAIVLPLPDPFTRAVSAGDLVILAGAALSLAEVVRRAGGRQQHAR